MEENKTEVMETSENEAKAEEIYDLNPAMEIEEDYNSGVIEGFVGGLGVAALGYGIYRGIKFAKRKYDEWKDKKCQAEIEDSDEEVDAEEISDEEYDSKKKK